jgi:hypothetical protein
LQIEISAQFADVIFGGAGEVGQLAIGKAVLLDLIEKFADPGR